MANSNGRQFVKYSFYKVDPLWRRLPEAERHESKREFAAVVQELAAETFTRSYSLVGLRDRRTRPARSIPWPTPTVGSS